MSTRLPIALAQVARSRAVTRNVVGLRVQRVSRRDFSALSLPRNRTSPVLPSILLAAVLSYLSKDQLLPSASAEAPELPQVDDTAGKITDAATGLAFPKSLKLTHSDSNLQLVGLGVRTVSFLRIQVYCAGLYASPDALRCLHRVQGWQNYTSDKLMRKPTSPEEVQGEQLMRNLMQYPVELAMRIVPTRNTDFAHLRDGLYRAVIGRMKLNNDLKEEEATEITAALDTFKSFFPKASVKKGESMVLLRTKEGHLAVEYEGKTLGILKNQWISRELLLSYFADKNPISERSKENIAQGFEQILKSRETVGMPANA